MKNMLIIIRMIIWKLDLNLGLDLEVNHVDLKHRITITLAQSTHNRKQ